MSPEYRIEAQYFDENYFMGVLIELKEMSTGVTVLKSPLAIFNDLALLEKLSPADVRLIGYMVGDYHTYVSQKLIHTNDWPETKN